MPVHPADPVAAAYKRIRRYVEREKRMPTLVGMRRMIAQERKKTRSPR